MVSAHSDIVPGHMNLDKLTDAVKSGIEAAGGTPFMVPAIGVCDGIAMGHVGMKYSLGQPGADLRQCGDHVHGSPV